ncbi:cellulose synthase subunit BcsC-related outer membrane protein [Xylophilus sp.]|uniref:cellulose synthase subunit BcsC-related outer membrane protein n=1 Tax=Xylophilus sp. TaxID=2653893 RepID=UPI002D808ECE|nr:cellulose synthase subunit BcsC-related outer membrane protein [Xylophilus sp.]
MTFRRHPLLLGTLCAAAGSAAWAQADCTGTAPAGGPSWQDVRHSLEQRALEAPTDVHARLALAQYLTYCGATRRDGIVQLSQLAHDRHVGPAALDSWRQALLWTEADGPSAPLFEAYLRLRPNDREVRTQWTGAGNAAAAAPQHQPGPPASPAPAVLTGSAYLPVPVPVPVSAPRADVPAVPAPVAGAAAGRIDESPSRAQLRNLQTEIADIQRERGTPELTAGLVVRSRSGEKGTSALTDTELPIQLRMDFGDGTLTAHLTPVSLHTGGIDTSYSTISRFGGGPEVATAQEGVSAGTQNTAGVGMGVGYEQGNLAVDIGTTPIGFRYTDVNGGVRYRVPVNEEFSFTMNLSRRAVNDSVLSFAGARDVRTGQEWGGVSANGARLDATYDRGSYGVYGYGSVARLLGHNVAANTRLEYGTGVYWRLVKQPDASLTAGLALSGMAFDRNLGYYTYGQGGYFSPQRFTSLGIPFDWQQRSGRLSYQLKGSLGVQHLRQDASDYFPTDATQQAAAASVYEAQRKTGVSYGLSAALEYQLAPQWFLGSRLGVDNSRNYRQYAGSVYLRYAFRAHEGPQAMPVDSVRSPYGN